MQSYIKHTFAINKNRQIISERQSVFKHNDITKRKWVLDGDTVLYSSFEMIRQTLEYDFREEKNIDYSTLNAAQAVKQICRLNRVWEWRSRSEKRLNIEGNIGVLTNSGSKSEK